MTEETMLCPTCHSHAMTRAIACGACDCHPITMRCYRCGGSGVVPLAMERWMIDGRRLRHRRITVPPYRNQRDEAERLGLDVLRLSRLEQGLEPGATALLEGECEST